VSAITRNIPLASGWKWRAADLFHDVRVRNGIKLGLAGLVALFLTQALRLPRDSWAILTVITTSFARFVGSTAVNAITRVLGTIAGAVIGVWLVGNYATTPIVFLPVFFVVMAFSTYKFGQFGPRQTPYSYFILGSTVLVVAANGLDAPNKAWQVGLYRAEEILVGVLSALLVSSVIWPRYARKEFITAARSALGSIEPLLSAQIEERPISAQSNAALDRFRQSFASRLAALDYLRRSGARESTLFSAQLPSYDDYLVTLARVFDGALYVGEPALAAASITDQVRTELNEVYRALVEEIRVLSTPPVANEPLGRSSLNAELADLERKVEELREQGFFLAQPLTARLAFGSHLAALSSLRDELDALRNISESLVQDRQRVPATEGCRHAPRTIDWSWVKIGIKGGIAATIAVTLLMWIHPPGTAYIPITAWLRIVISRPSFRLGGTGDLRAFQKAFLGLLVLAFSAVATLATTPIMASYLAMNLALFFMLFCFGFATATTPGISFGAQLSFLIISAFVGLNSQQPVLSQAVIDTFTGIGIGLFIGETVRRFIWPSLPQTVLRENLLGILADLKGLLGGAVHRDGLVRLAGRSVEAYQVVPQIPLPARWQTKGERERLSALTLELVALAPRVIHLTTLRDDLPQPAEPFLRAPLKRLKKQLIQVLDVLTDYIGGNFSRRDLPTLDATLSEADAAFRRIHDQGVLTNYPIRVPLLTLDIVARYLAVADALNKIRSMVIDTPIRRAWGDYAL
jgi:fusaric acid resistance family protein